MKLVIMTGGKGARLGPMTKDIPKPMIPVGGKPILEHIIETAKKHGIKEIILCNGYLHKAIGDYFGDGSKWGVNITHSNEDKPLGTAGALTNISPELLTEPFLVFQGDVMNELNIEKFVKFHNQKKGIMSIVVHPSDHPHDSDVIVVDKNWQVKDFLHKPGKDVKFENIVNAGAFIMDPSILNYIVKDEFSIIEKHIFPKLLESKEKIYAYMTDDYLKDMGTPDRLEKVEAYLKKK